MQFRIADTFTDSLAKLTGDEQKAVKTAAFDLQMNPAHPGLKLHQVDPGEGQGLLVRSGQPRHPADRPPDRFQLPALLRRSSRRGVSMGRTTASGTASDDRRCPARRDPRDGSRDSGAAVCGGGRSPRPPEGPRLADRRRRGPRSSPTHRTTICWATVCPSSGWTTCGPRRRTRCSTSPIICRERPPGRCCSLRPAVPLTARWRPWRAPIRSRIPDAQRRFRVMADVEALERALDYPWEKWTVFLHPAQRQLVEREYSGPARVSGSAEPARPSWRSTGRCIWRAHIPRAVCCWPPSPMRWPLRYGRVSGASSGTSRRSPSVSKCIR